MLFNSMVDFETSQSKVISLRSLCWRFFFWDELYVFHGCEALSQCSPSSAVNAPLVFVSPSKSPMKPDLDTPCFLLSFRGLIFLGLSLVGTCFLRGFLFPGAFSICAQSSDFNAAFHYIMMALALKWARVLGCGNGAINLNKDRVSLLSQRAALERGVTACTLAYGKPIPLLRKRSLQAFHPCYQFLTICLIFRQILSLLATGDGFSCCVSFLGGNLPCYFSVTTISFDTSVPGWAMQQMSGYLKFFLSTVICNLKNQQRRARSCWFCSPLRRISSQQMP